MAWEMEMMIFDGKMFSIQMAQYGTLDKYF